MRILIIGSGGREHALAWKIAQSKQVKQVFIAPGNAGTASVGKNIDIGANDFAKMATFAEKEKIDLTIVGPEDPLVNGIVDFFQEKGLNIFGPDKKAAIIEGSKTFCRNLLKKYGIPSAEFASFDSAEKAKDYLHKKGAPIVVKADGLAAGKGAVVCDELQEAEQAIDKMMVKKEFGEAGSRVVLEEKLVGEECSFIVFSDGKNIQPMVSSQDHKPVFDNDKGLNTGGMGAYSPAPVVTKQLEKEILGKIMQPTVDALRKEGRLFKGVLYGGLMITEHGPKVIEFNCRFGDPETQVILPRLESDLVPILQGCIDGKLAKQKIKWSKKACCCVAMASGGYPGHYEKGKEIFGLKEAAKLLETVVFHAGTKQENGKILTNGGRVLGVIALGKTIKGSIDNAYNAV
ncbi:MAG: phosphoribosylamine--glycine ligase, partial [Candidatus Diapherotrites archaeon]|nr:phosphoribosylamine--glycine ligase [Candidatus Diapherotrites archaeon]